MIGKILAGRYRVGERIGGGGMALVYRAVDLQLGRDVAIKVLRTQFVSDEEFVRRFRREATSAASLSHPNVVQIYDVGQDEGYYYIVMELIEGKTLKELIHEQGPLPVADAARIAAEVLAALAHAHMHRIVHRDIKPHNILIARDGRVKVADFGIARATTTDTVTHTGSIMGSAHYFSPEQANGHPTGEKSDLYSLGVVLYEMVTGVVPFQGESPITVALKHLREEPMPPTRLNAEVPVELEELILRALEKDPDDRFPSADAMRGALQKFLMDHAAGRTHMPSGDFPTMDLRAMRNRKVRRGIEEEREVAVSKPRKRSLAWLWISLIALAVVGGIGGAVYAAINYVDVPVTQVPPIVGLQLTEAQDKLTAVKLRWKVQGEPQFSDKVPQGAIISTEPPAGDTVKINREIALTLSKGPESRQVPDVRNMTETDARNLLESAGFKVSEPKRQTSTLVEEGRVLEQTPPPMTLLNAGGTVNLVVSQGSLRVPKIYGKSLKEAQDAIVKAGLVVGQLTDDPRRDPTKTKGTVLSSDPPQDTPVAPGTRVNLVVAVGSSTNLGKPFGPKELTVPGTPGRYSEISVRLVDQVSGVATDQVLLAPIRKLAGEKITVRGTFFGDAYLKVIVDGVDVQHVDLP